jgi:hypothetical protein
MSAPQYAASPPSTSASPSHAQHARPAGWVVGLSLFAGIMLMVMGVFNAFEGLAALFTNEVYVNTPRYVFAFDVTAWGWIQLVLGLVILGAGFGVMSGRIWGRVVGIGVALVTMIANFAFIPYYPVWSLLIIVLSVFVIWALCVFNRDAAAEA